MKTIIFCSIVLLLGTFLPLNFSFAVIGGSCPVPPCSEPAPAPPEEPPCTPGPTTCSTEVSAPFRCDDFAVYKCSNNFCGKASGAMEQGVEWYTCQTTTENCSNGCDSSSSSATEHISGPDGPDQIQSYGQVGEYQVCPAEFNDWGETPPTPTCSGSCYLPPILKSLDDDSLSPKNISENSKYKLPINFGWEDNVEKEIVKAPNFCTVGSYEFNIPEPPLSEIIPNTRYDQLVTTSDSAYKLECQLKSNLDYQWQVRACLDSGGTDCGEWSDTSNFSTNLAPELVGPYDPDWQGAAQEGSTPTPVFLDWCDVKEANSLLLKIYILQGGEKICHPSLLSTKDGQAFCDSWIIRGKRRDPEQLEKKIFSDFTDEDMYFFTGDTNYGWEIATCTDNSGLECKDFSQQWTFTTKEKESLETFLISPPNDPLGQKPVGLSLVLDWRKDPGINSWRYKIDSKEEFSNVSGSRSLDYPELSLNSFYQWQVLSCTDYEGKKCQETWSETYTFKTTGQPPELIYPAAGATDIPIAVDFDWQDVPGAKSYIISIQGEGLDMNKTLNESDFSVDFPEFPIKQETNYTWQIKTCAKDNGQVCGAYSSPQGFRTFRIAPPSKPLYPQNGGMLFTDEHFLSWEKVTGAKAYQYETKLLAASAEEQSQTCSVPPLRTVLASSDYIELGCLGQYQWQARSCFDSQCQETSNWSSPWTFTFLEGGSGTAGLVPCGRATDNPKTPWSEREPCQIKHLFLLVQIIIDFLLIKIMPVIIVLLTVTTAVVLYTPFSQMVTMAQIRSLWKSAGIGLALILFAWVIVNLLLKFAGYNIGVFGNWYQLPSL